MTPLRRILTALAVTFLGVAAAPLFAGAQPAPVTAAIADHTTPDGYGGYGAPHHQPSPRTLPSTTPGSPSASVSTLPSTPASTSAAASPARTLPITGSRPGPVALIGALAVIAGVILVAAGAAWSRRRRHAARRGSFHTVG